MTVLFLIRRLVASRPVLVITIVAFVASLAGGTVVSKMVSQTARSAIAESVSASLGNRNFAIHVVDPAAGAALDNRRDLISIRDDIGVVSTGSAELPVSLRTVSVSNAGIEKLVDGRRALDLSEVTVSRFIATSLDVGVGSELVVVSDVGETRVSIVGVTTTPADRRASVVVTVDPQLKPSGSSTVLTDTDIVDPVIDELFSRRSLISIGVVSLAEEEAVSGGDELLSVLDVSLPGAAAVTIVAVGVVFMLLSRRTRTHREALQVTGMKQARSELLFAHAALLLLVAGIVLAVVVGWLLVWFGKSQISSWLGQDWVAVSTPWGELFWFAAVVLGALGMGLYMGPVVSRSGLRLPRLAIPRWAAILLIGAWFPLIGLWLAGLLSVEIAGMWGAIAAIAVPFAIGVPQLLDRKPARRRFTTVMATSLVPIVVATSALTWFTSNYAAGFAHDFKTSIADSARPQPPGSLLMYEAPSGSIDVLRDAYQRVGGRDVEVFALPVESERRFRAASRLLTGCMADNGLTDSTQVDQSCSPSDSASTVNVFLLSLDDPNAGVTADPSLIEDGEIGVLIFTPTSGGNAVANLSVPATPDPQLGANMPGGVVGVDSPVAVDLGMTPSSGRLAAFLDFDSLDDSDQASFRSLIRQVAGAAQVTDGSGYYLGANQSLALSRSIAVTGAALVALIVGFGGIAAVEAQRANRRVLIDIGSTRRQRRKISRRVMAVPVLATTSASAFGLLSAWITGIHTGAGFGYIWLLPGTAALVAWVVVGWAFTTAPPR